SYKLFPTQAYPGVWLYEVVVGGHDSILATQTERFLKEVWDNRQKSRRHSRDYAPMAKLLKKSLN
ncbi:MAG: hypothetical protein RIR34_706, partial [Actinomycetota bacterium]